MDLDAAQIARRLRGVAPEAVREHGVLVEGVLYPVKQVFELGSGVPCAAFTSQTARRHLHALGFELSTNTDPPISQGSVSPDPARRGSAAGG
jgi:hypothetical protein